MTIGNPARRLAIVGVLVLGLAAAAGATGHKQPPAERLLAGYTTEKHDSVRLRDTKTGYYLVRQSECDGSHLHLALYRDSTCLKDWLEPGKTVPTGRLRSVQTGRGLGIGDTSSRIRRIMGTPTWQGGSRYSRGESVWSYHHLIGTRAKGVEYITVVRFRNGLVTGIELDREVQPG